MDDTEKQALLKVEVAAEEQASLKAELAEAPRNKWDSHLLSCLGNGDRHGVAAFGSTVACLPLSLRHNVRAVGGDKNARCLVLFVSLAVIAGITLCCTTSLTDRMCGPMGAPHHHHHHHHHAHDDPQLEPKGQHTFLAGATLDPELAAMHPQELKDEPIMKGLQSEEPGFTVTVDGQTFNLGEFEETNAQIQLAKNSALEGMNQFQLGRKLLHKKHHDDEHAWKHKKCGKDKKPKDKKPKHDDDDDDDEDDRDPEGMKHETFDARFGSEPEPRLKGPHGGPDPSSLECQRALKLQGFGVLVFTFSVVSAIVSGYRWRVNLRKQFNIEGSKVQDCLAWTFCAPCAICQETRTLTKNNCEHGVWHGPSNFPPPTQAPLTQKIDGVLSTVKV